MNREEDGMNPRELGTPRKLGRGGWKGDSRIDERIDRRMDRWIDGLRPLDSSPRFAEMLANSSSDGISARAKRHHVDVDIGAGSSPYPSGGCALLHCGDVPTPYPLGLTIQKFEVSEYRQPRVGMHTRAGCQQNQIDRSNKQHTVN